MSLSEASTGLRADEDAVRLEEALVRLASDGELPELPPTRKGEPELTPAQEVRLRAKMQVQMKVTATRAAFGVFKAALAARHHANNLAEKAQERIFHPKPPRVKMGKVRAALYFSRWEQKIDKAAHEAQEAHVSFVQAEKAVLKAKLLARDLELARLRKLLRKHKN